LICDKEGTHRYNSSLNAGICPEDWNTFTIKSIPKIDKPKKASSDSSMLTTFEKVLVVKNNWMNT